MRMVRRTAVVAALVVGTVGAAGSLASADPTGSKNSFSFPTNCGGRALQFVVNSANGQGGGTENGTQAEFTPAHVVGTNEVFLPTAFNLTFTFTPTGSTTPFTFTDTATRKNQQGTTTCSIHVTETDPDGTFTINGTVVGNFR